MGRIDGTILLQLGRQAGAVVSNVGSQVSNPFSAGLTDPGKYASEADKAAYRRGMARHGTRMSALGGLASQAPGGAMLQGVGKAFASGGKIAGMAAGVTAIVGIVKQLLGMSKIFGTMTKTFFQMTSMMIDIALMPLIPLFMRFLQWWMREGTRKAQEFGQWFAKNGPTIAKAMVGLAKLVGFLAGSAGGGDRKNPINWLPPSMSMPMKIGIAMGRDRVGLASGGIVTGPTNALIGEAGPEAVIPLKGGGGGGSGMEKFFNTITSGMTGTAGIFESYQKKAASTVSKIKVNARRNMEQWYFDMLGGSIVPDTIDSVGGVYEGMKNAAETNLQKTESQEPGMLAKIGGIFGAAWDGIKAGWNIASDWTSRAFGWLNPFGGEKKEPDPEGVTEDNGTPWYSGWSSTIGTMWANSKEWISNAWGWLNPFGGDKDSPEGDIDAEDSDEKARPWYSTWTGTIGTMWANSKDWISGAWNWLNPFSSDDGPPENDVEASDTDGTSWYSGWATTIGNMWKNSKAWAKKAWGWLNPFDSEDEEPDPYSIVEASGSSWYLPWTWNIGAMWSNTKAWAKKAWSWLWPFGKDEEPEHEDVTEEKGSGTWYKDWGKALGDMLGKARDYVRSKFCEIFKSIPYFWGRDKVLSTLGFSDCIGVGEVSLDTGGMANDIKNNAEGGGFWSGVGSGLSGIKGKFGFKNLGGVIPGPIGAPVPTLMHGGETVLPTHLGTNWAAATSGNMIASGGRSLDGAGGGGVFAPSVSRPMNIQIYTTENASDVITRLDRMSNLEDAAFFSTV